MNLQVVRPRITPAIYPGIPYRGRLLMIPSWIPPKIFPGISSEFKRF